MAKRIASEVRPEWFEELPCAVTVCDRDYKILYMNRESAEVNAKDGGKKLIGKSLMDCNPVEAQAKLRKVMASGKPNVFTVERKGVKKLAYECHWRKGGRVGGLLEIYFELPKDLPNHIRS